MLPLKFLKKINNVKKNEPHEYEIEEYYFNFPDQKLCKIIYEKSKNRFYLSCDDKISLFIYKTSKIDSDIIYTNNWRQNNSAGYVIIKLIKQYQKDKIFCTTKKVEKENYSCDSCLR